MLGFLYRSELKVLLDVAYLYEVLGNLNGIEGCTLLDLV